jgi:hypothetical protein
MAARFVRKQVDMAEAVAKARAALLANPFGNPNPYRVDAPFRDDALQLASTSSSVASPKPSRVRLSAGRVRTPLDKRVTEVLAVDRCNLPLERRNVVFVAVVRSDDLHGRVHVGVAQAHARGQAVRWATAAAQDAASNKIKRLYKEVALSREDDAKGLSAARHSMQFSTSIYIGDVNSTEINVDHVCEYIKNYVTKKRSIRMFYGRSLYKIARFGDLVASDSD